MKYILLFLTATNLLASDAIDLINAKSAMDYVPHLVTAITPSCKIQVADQIEGETKTEYERLLVLPEKWKDCQAGRVKKKDELVCTELELPSCVLPTLAEIETKWVDYKAKLINQQLKRELEDRCQGESNRLVRYWVRVVEALSPNQGIEQARAFARGYCGTANESEINSVIATVEGMIADDNVKEAAKTTKFLRIQELKTKGWANLTASEKAEAQNFLMERL